MTSGKSEQTPNTRTVLKGKDAAKLWHKGIVEWNLWVEENPDADVDFSNVDFSKLRPLCRDGVLSFANFEFPKGNVSFAFARFGNGDVDFENAHFKAGKIDFSGAEFGVGKINFEFTHFEEGEVSFTNTDFGTGDVIFHCTHFGDGRVSFEKTKFGDGDISFFGSQFGKGNIIFNHSVHDKGSIGFIYTQFGSGNLLFNDVTLKERQLVFKEAQLGEGMYEFKRVFFGLPLNLVDLIDTKKVTQLNFQGSIFDADVDMGSMSLTQPVNLIDTEFNGKLNLDTIDCQLIREPFNPKMQFLLKAKDNKVHLCFERLAQLAEMHSTQEKFEEYKCKQYRSRRWVIGNPAKSIFDLCFSGIAGYGYDFKRPVITLVASGIIFSLLYFAMTSAEHDYCSNITTPINISWSSMVPVVQVASEIRDQFTAVCMSKNTRGLLQFFMLFQGTLALICYGLLFTAAWRKYR